MIGRNVPKAHIPPETAFTLCTHREHYGDMNNMKSTCPTGTQPNANHMPPGCVEVRVGHDAGNVMQNKEVTRTFVFALR